MVPIYAPFGDQTISVVQLPNGRGLEYNKFIEDCQGFHGVGTRIHVLPWVVLVCGPGWFHQIQTVGDGSRMDLCPDVYMWQLAVTVN